MSSMPFPSSDPRLVGFVRARKGQKMAGSDLAEQPTSCGQDGEVRGQEKPSVVSAASSVMDVTDTSQEPLQVGMEDPEEPEATQQITGG